MVIHIAACTGTFSFSLSLSGFLLSGEEARVALHFPWTRRRQQAQNRSVPSEHKDYLLCGAELAKLAGRRATDCLLLTETKVSSSRDQSAARPKCKGLDLTFYDEQFVINSLSL